MSLRYLGGVIKPSYNPLAANVTVSPTVVQTGGVYTLQQQAQAQGQQQWSHDPYFNNTTLLLHADNFVNGSQNNTFLVTPPGGVGSYSGSFNGSTQYLSIPANAAFNFGTGDFTIEAWVYIAANSSLDLSNRREALVFATLSGTSYGIVLTIDGNSTTTGTGLSLYTSNASSSTTGVTGTIPQQTWNHIAVSRSGSSVYYWLNGIQMGATQSITGNWGSSTQTAFIGKSTEPNYPFPLNGYVSNLRVINGTALYTSAFTPPTSPLTAVTNTSLLTCQSATFVDNSTNNFTITNNGTATIVNPNSFPVVTRNGTPTQGTFTPYGDVWSVYNTDAADNGFGVGANAALNMGTGDFTIEAWVNTAKLPTTNAFQTSSGGYQAIFATGPTNSGTGSQLYIGVTNLKFDIATDGGGPIDVAHNMVAGQWYHVAITRSGTTFRAFINGILVQTATSSTSWVDGFGWGIGRAEPVGAFTGAWWYGYISNFRAVKGTALYTASFNPSTTPLTAVSGTALLVAQSNRFKDNSTNNFAISFGATAPSVQRFAPFSPSSGYSPSVYSGSGYFNGNGDYVAVPNSTSLTFDAGDFTVEGWFYATSATFSNNVMGLGIWSSISTFAQSWILYFNTSKQPVFLIDVATVDTTVFTSSTAITSNAWNHIAVTRSGNSWYMFLNGVTVATTTNTSTVNAGTGALYIGSYQNRGASDLTWPGYISDVRIIKGTALYTANFTPPTAPLTAVAKTSLLLSYTNAGIYDNGMQNALTTVSTAQVNTSIVKYGSGSMKFNGSSDYLSLLNSPLNTLGDFTTELWYYPASTSNQTLFSFGGNTTGYATLRLDYEGSTGKIYMLVSTSGSAWAVNVGSSVTIPTGTWAHVAAVRSGSTFTIYINGVSAGTATSSSTLYASTVNLIGVAYNSGSLTQYLNGYIDDLRVTKGVARYLSNFTPPQIGMANQ